MKKGKKIHLIISAITITVVALTYGLFPNNILPKLFNFDVASVDLKNVFRATMGLYLSMVVLWVIGILKPIHWRTATISNVCFMFGLAFGRIISLAIDGFPSIIFSVGLALELTLDVWGISNLNKSRSPVSQEKLLQYSQE